jgi:hypothetical protein
MGDEHDFSSPSVPSPGSQEAGAEQAESGGRAAVGGSHVAVGGMAAGQKAAEITIENKKTAQTENEIFCPITHDIDEAKNPSTAAVG